MENEENEEIDFFEWWEMLDDIEREEYNRCIVDLGCAYATQAYYFLDYREYIGVDMRIPDFHFKTPNSKFYQMSIQDFCMEVVKNKWNLENMFAICSFVPDEDARKLVRETFPYCLVYYPMH